ncbi:unnamed protein product [Brachionus calyciflorus]|uniref:C2 domain-containing protein n=1 Tax=Brachionus calyciflorus TaxID=104777 RepID=A0A813SIG9_9BILA|nr:unnamed protein product [Brachionus calyciflorus]
MYSEFESIFDLSAPLAVFNSSLCNNSIQMNDDSNNNNNTFSCENQNIYENIDEFNDEDILCIYQKKETSLTSKQRFKLKWLKAIIAVYFIQILKNNRNRSQFKIPLITITSSSTINKTLNRSKEDVTKTPELQVALRNSCETVKTPSERGIIKSKQMIVNLHSNCKSLIRKRENKVIDRDGSFIVYSNVGSATSLINSPNIRLYSIDLKTPSSPMSNSGCYKEHNYYYLRKTAIRSLTLSNQSSTPYLIKSLHNKSLKNDQLKVGKRNEFLSANTQVIKPSFSYSSIPYIDQEELDKLFKCEYNLQVINLSEFDAEHGQNEEDLKLNSSDGNIIKNQLLNTNQKALEHSTPLGKIQLKLFHDSIENKLYVNVLTILLNQQQFNLVPNLENIFFKLQLLNSSFKKELYSKISDTCSVDESSGAFYANEAFTFDSVDSNTLSDINIQIETINSKTKQTIGKANIIPLTDMFENRLIESDLYPANITEMYFNNLTKSKPTIGVSVESLNSGSLNSRRRQLPQIPLDKQREKPDKTTTNLAEKARRLKMNMKLSKENSISDSESSIVQSKKRSESNDTSNQKTKQLENQVNHSQLNQVKKSLETHELNMKNESQMKNSGIKKENKIDHAKNHFDDFEKLNGPNSNNYEKDLKLINTNNDDIGNYFSVKPKNKAQMIGFENNNFINSKPSSQITSPTSTKDLRNDFNKNQSWTELEKIDKEKPRVSTVSKFESNEEDSLYLNTNKKNPSSSSPPNLFSLGNSSSQTFPQFNKPTPTNNSNTKPEKLFSTNLLNQRTQNAVLNSTKITQNQPGAIQQTTNNKAINGFEGDSDASENNNFSKNQNQKSIVDLNNKGANNFTNSNLINDPNQTDTLVKNPASKSATTSNKLNQITKLNPSQEKNDGTMSDSALTNPMNSLPETANKKRRPSMAKALVILGLSKKSNSASNLTNNKRLGFARSEEYGVMPELRNRNLSPSSGDSSAEDKKPKLWSGTLKLPHERPLNEFVENLGPGQKVSRQVLGLACLGEIKLKMNIEKQKLTIQVVEVKKLKPKIGYRILPNIYIKFYLYNGSVCTEKQKTSSQRRTLTPVYEETLRFESDYKNKFLQITVWGDFSKLDRKVFMGIIQIALDDCNLVEGVNGWYKLYPASSLITDVSSIAAGADLSNADSGYSLASHKSVK